MNYNIFLQKLGNDNHCRNYKMNDRYFKKAFTINNNINKINSTIQNNNIVSGKNSKSISISEAIKKIENLKRKYNKLNFQKQINSKIVYKKILKLKEKYFNGNNKVSNTENNLNSEKNNKNINLFKIESTDKITMINKSWNKKPNLNLRLYSNDNLDNNSFNIETLSNDKKIKLQKRNEINYQIRSETQSKAYNKNRFNINLYKNYSENNNKKIRDEFLYLDKKINLLLKDDDSINDKNYNEYFFKNKRLKSVCPIKDRIILLTDVKNKIKKINKDSFEGNEKTQNSEFSIDSQITLGFKHIKPVIKKENFYQEYLKDDEPKEETDRISKPILIRSLPRPKLNVPNYPSFFHK